MREYLNHATSRSVTTLFSANPVCNRTALLAAYGLIFGTFCGCATMSRNSTVSLPYKLTVSCCSSLSDPEASVVITVHPDVPFSVRAKDKAGCDFQVSGTLRQKTSEKFQIEAMSVSIGFSSGNGAGFSTPQELMLDRQAYCSFGGINGGLATSPTSFGIRLTSK